MTRYSNSSSVDAPGFLKVFSPQMHSVELFLKRTGTRSRVLIGVALSALFLTIVAPAQQTTSDQQQTTTQEPQLQALSVDVVRPEGIRAGVMSGGFFHASVGALAMKDPKLLASRIQRSGDDYIVTFADGKFTQRVTAAEVQAVRSSGFDRSDDPWVAALYRAYEMRVLWDVIHFSIGHLNFSPNIKVKAAEMMDKSPWLVLAYERAIRAKVSPTGDLDEATLRLAVREELKSTKENEDAKKSAENMLLSIDMFRDTSKAVKDNGELFGAYKAAGNAELPDRIVDALAGKAQALDKPTGHVVNAALKDVREKKRAAVVSTPDLALSKLKTRPPGPLPWYAPLHAYTVVESTTTTVTLRNPCADQGKDTFKVPAASLASVFAHVTVQQ